MLIFKTSLALVLVSRLAKQIFWSSVHTTDCTLSIVYPTVKISKTINGSLQIV